MRSLGVRGGRESVGQEPAAGLRKIDNFFAKKAGGCYCFSERPISPAGASHRRRGTGTSALETGNDPEMAPQAIEIAKNGLGDRRSAPMLEGLLGSEADLALRARG